MTHDTHVTTEREGHCAACSCRWERWAADVATARRYAAEHARQHTKKEG